MKNIHLLALLLGLLLTSCQPDRDTAAAKSLIAQVKKKHAPDKRVALFVVDTNFLSKPLLLKGETNLPEAKKELLQLLAEAKIPFSDSLQLLPHPNLSGKNFGVVNVSVCNIRSKPGHDEEMATQAILGTPLRVHKEQDGYYLVQTPDDYFGWLDDGGLALMDSAQYAVWRNAPKVVCLSDYAFAFEQPNATSQKVTDLMAGTFLQVLDNQGGFSKVQFPDGRNGFVPAAQLMPATQWLATRQPDAEHLLAAAREMMGRPYLWGGTSGKGMDCSGFTRTVFYLNGVQIPRDASQQVHVGEAVETDSTMKNMLPGDLLFFGRKGTPELKEKITHVAIYLGEGQIIHASNKVELGSMRRGEPGFDENRLRTFVRTKRVLGSVGKNGVLDLKASEFYKVREPLKG